MYRDRIKSVLADVKSGEVSLGQALKELENLPYEDLGFANVDHHRALRQGFPEVVFCLNKTPEQVAAIFAKLTKHPTVLATRASQETYEAVRAVVPRAEYNELAKTITLRHGRRKKKSAKQILVVSAGTSDIPVAEEARVTADMMGNTVETLYDVGVAGIHRLFGNKDRLDAANVLVVVAGMDGVLPSVVSGVVDKPVVAVPTSVGYGTAFEGVAPLLTMLNSCAPGVAVVNIDNGFGAGYFASMINR